MVRLPCCWCALVAVALVGGCSSESASGPQASAADAICYPVPNGGMLLIRDEARIDPYGSGSLTATLRPGRYLLVCTVPHHYVRDQMVATITVSSSSAQAVYDRATGTTAKPTWDAALVRVEFSPALGLPAGANTIEIAPKQTQTILAGTPLESTITVADGRPVTNDDGTQGAVADVDVVVRLQGQAGPEQQRQERGRDEPPVNLGRVVVRLRVVAVDLRDRVRLDEAFQ